MKIENIDKKFIKFDPENPRSELDDDEIALLQKSIEEEGQKEPVHLEELGKNDYMVNEGHKRVAAIIRSKNINTVSAIVEQKLSPEERLFKQIIIDTHRKNWNIADRDRAWTKLWKMGDYDVKSFAKKLSITKDIAESFVDRMDLGADFVEKIPKVSAYNITETKYIKDKNLRKKVLKHANENELARKSIRKLSKIAPQVSEKIMKEVVDNKISIDDAENLVGLDDEKQTIALETTKALNTHKKNLKKMMSDGSISVEDKPIVKDMTDKITTFQQRFFKLSGDLRSMSYGLNQIKKVDAKKYINTQMEDILKSCLTELEDSITPAIKDIKKTIGDLK